MSEDLVCEGCGAVVEWRSDGLCSECAARHHGAAGHWKAEAARLRAALAEMTGHAEAMARVLEGGLGLGAGIAVLNYRAAHPRKP
jgi:hypothetical protein